METTDILLVETRGEGLLDKRGVASATGQKKIKDAYTEAKKSESHDGEKEKLREEFVEAETEEEDEDDDEQTRAKTFSWRKELSKKKKFTSHENAITDPAELIEKQKMEELGVFGQAVHFGALHLVKNHSESWTFAHNVQTRFLEVTFCEK